MRFKKIIVNILLLCLACFLPLYILHSYNYDSRIIESIQVRILIIVFIGAGLLFYLNHKYRKQALTKKWIWLIFEIVGIVGLCYSGFILWLIFVFRHALS